MANLLYEIFDYAANLFAGEQTGFSHDDMANFFCHHMGDRADGLRIPSSINRKKKFKWFLGRFTEPEQRRLLEQLCRHEYDHAIPYNWPSGEQRNRLLRMLGGCPIEVTCDAAHIQEAWRKALDRRHQDPEGAITAARSLLESVCKHILDELEIEYQAKWDLPKLYGIVAQELGLAPNQHSEEVFKKILGGAHSVVDGLANLRNRLGDAHGQGKRPVRPAPRHAELAVNMAGSMASFLLETLEVRSTNS